MGIGHNRIFFGCPAEQSRHLLRIAFNGRRISIDSSFFSEIADPRHVFCENLSFPHDSTAPKFQFLNIYLPGPLPSPCEKSEQGGVRSPGGKTPDISLGLLAAIELSNQNCQAASQIHFLACRLLLPEVEEESGQEGDKG